MDKVDALKEILNKVEFPEQMQSNICIYTILALANIKKTISSPLPTKTITPVMQKTLVRHSAKKRCTIFAMPLWWKTMELQPIALITAGASPMIFFVCCAI